MILAWVWAFNELIYIFKELIYILVRNIKIAETLKNKDTLCLSLRNFQKQATQPALSRRWYMLSYRVGRWRLELAGGSVPLMGALINLKPLTSVCSAGTFPEITLFKISKRLRQNVKFFLALL